MRNLTEMPDKDLPRVEKHPLAAHGDLPRQAPGPPERMPAPRLTGPTTAYDLLTRIRELITEEPRRYNQDDWIKLVEKAPDAPACGTVCCVAGWVQTLRSSPVEAITLRNVWQADTNRLAISAQRALGLTMPQARILFDGSAVAKLAYRDKVRQPDKGTPEYAAFGVRHIRNFQRRHSKQLRAKVVRPARAKAEAK